MLALISNIRKDSNTTHTQTPTHHLLPQASVEYSIGKHSHLIPFSGRRGGIWVEKLIQRAVWHLVTPRKRFLSPFLRDYTEGAVIPSQVYLDYPYESLMCRQRAGVMALEGLEKQMKD